MSPKSDLEEPITSNKLLRDKTQESGNVPSKEPQKKHIVKCIASQILEAPCLLVKEIFLISCIVMATEKEATSYTGNVPKSKKQHLCMYFSFLDSCQLSDYIFVGSLTLCRYWKSCSKMIKMTSLHHQSTIHTSSRNLV